MGLMDFAKSLLNQAGPAGVICTNCGDTIPGGKNFCPNCGAPAPMPAVEGICPHCGSRVDAGDAFCGECGALYTPPAPKTISCANCGSEIPASKKFCPRCGAPVSGAHTYFFTPLKNIDGVLRDRDTAYIGSESVKFHRAEFPRIWLGPNALIKPYGEGSYIEFLRAGYYLFAPVPFVPQHFVTDIADGNWGACILEEVYRHNAVVLHVINE